MKMKTGYRRVFLLGVFCCCMLLAGVVSPVWAWETLSDNDPLYYQHPSTGDIYSKGKGQHECFAYNAAIRAGYSEDMAEKIMGYAGYPDTERSIQFNHLFPLDALDGSVYGWKGVSSYMKRLKNAPDNTEKQFKLIGSILHMIADSCVPYHSSHKWQTNHGKYENKIADNWASLSPICNTTSGTYEGPVLL